MQISITNIIVTFEKMLISPLVLLTFLSLGQIPKDLILDNAMAFHRIYIVPKLIYCLESFFYTLQNRHNLNPVQTPEEVLMR